MYLVVRTEKLDLLSSVTVKQDAHGYWGRGIGSPRAGGA